MLFSINKYIFYLSYKQYQKWGEKDIPGIYALCVIMFLQEANFFSLYIIGILLKIPQMEKVKGCYIGAFFLIFFLMDYLYI